MGDAGRDASTVDILMAAGEPSGDRHGADLASHLRLLLPGCRLWGMGGEAMARAGVEIQVSYEDLSVVGLVEVLGHLGAAVRARQALMARARKSPPHLAVLIDFPDFNLWLARGLKRLKIPIFYYISPQVWAWRRKRVKLMARLLDQVGVILPFEEPLLRRAGVAARYVGHPLVAQLREGSWTRDPWRALDLPQGTSALALLPGSRPQEVRRHLPVMLRATRLIQDKAEGILPLVALSPMLSVDEVQGILASSPSEVRIYQGKTREVLLASRAAVVASGTATLEAALLGTPMVVIYRTSWLSYLLGRLLIRVPHISLVNLLAGEELVPELVQGALTPEAIRRHLLVLLCNTDKRNRMIRGFEEIRKSLGEEVAGRRAAQIVREMIRSGAAGGAGA